MHPYVSTSYLSVDIKQCRANRGGLIQSMLIDVKLRERTEMTHARLIEWHQRTHCEVACESVVGVKWDVTFGSADFCF